MDIEAIRSYYLSLPFVREEFPFDEDILVFKVGSKMFGLIPLNSEDPFIQLKCDPERAMWLRDHYEGIQPAWHMNKMHWNKVLLRRDVGRDELLGLIKHSYDLVWNKLSNKEKALLNANQYGVE